MDGNFKGQCLCQCQVGCHNVWNPDREEQRYCWACHIWFNMSCLHTHEKTQNDLAGEKKALECYEGYAGIIVEVAFQPTARGGAVHFSSGNARIVRQARELLDLVDSDNHPQYVAHILEAEGDPGFNTEEVWADIMEATVGLKKASRGDINHEQLIVRDQKMYSCPICDNMV